MSHVHGCFRSDGDWFCAPSCTVDADERREDATQARIVSAVAAERERCARIAEEECRWVPLIAKASLDRAADAIRSGAPAGPGPGEGACTCLPGRRLLIEHQGHAPGCPLGVAPQ